MSEQWKISAESVLAASPVVPVLVIDKLDYALPLARALVAGGIPVLEITLRTDAALDAIKLIAEQVPDAIVGAGTVTNAEQLAAVTEAGAKFAISPGMTSDLLKAGTAGSIPLIPGISSTSELMNGLDAGYRCFKFFPAEACGGVKAIKAISGPFADVTFCPTGGIGSDNYLDYLALDNVPCVGGSWLAPVKLMEQGDWEGITDLAQQAIARIQG